MLGSSAGLIIAALIGIAVIVCLIVFAKVHAFLALMLGSFVMAILAGVPPYRLVHLVHYGIGRHGWQRGRPDRFGFDDWRAAYEDRRFRSDC